jgi:7-carboxy-7-deazaguanine synthase
LPVGCDLMSISPKLASSAPPAHSDARWQRRHERSRHVPEVVRRLIAEHPYQIKFVIDSPADCDEVADYLTAMPQIDRSRVLLMPQGTTSEELARRGAWLQPYCRRHKLRFCPRRQIEWFGAVRGT